LDPQNEDLLNNFISKGSVYSEYILSSLNQYNEVRRSSRNKEFIYKNYEDSFIFGVNSNQTNHLKLFTGTTKGSTHANFIGLSKALSEMRLGFIYTDNNGKAFSHSNFFGSSSSDMKFKTTSAFIERPIALNYLELNIGISYDKIFIDSFEEKGDSLNLHFNSLNALSQNIYIDIHYPFEILGFSGSLSLGHSKRKFSSLFDLQSKESFNFTSNTVKNHFDGEINLVKGPLFLSITYLEDKSPIFNIGFNVRPY
jgi:hypothetical protein